MQKVKELLAQERQLCLVAGPGEGKSVLAAEVAHSLSAKLQLEGGVYLIDLADAPQGVSAVKIGLRFIRATCHPRIFDCILGTRNLSVVVTMLHEKLVLVYAGDPEALRQHIATQLAASISNVKVTFLIMVSSAPSIRATCATGTVCS